jgi:hypothetical protein
MQVTLYISLVILYRKYTGRGARDMATMTLRPMARHGGLRPVLPAHERGPAPGGLSYGDTRTLFSLIKFTRTLSVLTLRARALPYSPLHLASHYSASPGNPLEYVRKYEPFSASTALSTHHSTFTTPRPATLQK